MVLALLCSLTFLVPIESGEKLSLGISILLAFSVLVLILSEVTPQTSKHAPILGGWRCGWWGLVWQRVSPREVTIVEFYASFRLKIMTYGDNLWFHLLSVLLPLSLVTSCVSLAHFAQCVGRFIDVSFVFEYETKKKSWSLVLFALWIYNVIISYLSVSSICACASKAITVIKWGGLVTYLYNGNPDIRQRCLYLDRCLRMPNELRRLSALFSGLYLTAIMGLTGFNLFCQMVIMNLYFYEPVTEMLTWLKSIVLFFKLVWCQRDRKIQPTKGELSKDPGQDIMITDAESVKELKSDQQMSLDENVMKGIRLFVEKVEFENKQAEMKNEWKSLARMLDMTFFVITFVMDITMMILYLALVS